MLLELFRRKPSEISTIGDLFINHERNTLCQTLEDVVRPTGVKISGKTAIPEGDYMVVMAYSPKYNRVMPRLLNVPMFDGILIHPLNLAEQTDGCIGVGYYNPNSPDWISNSKDAFEKLYIMLEEAAKKQCICISIRNHA